MTSKHPVLTVALPLLMLLAGCSQTDQADKPSKAEVPVTAREAQEQSLKTAAAAKDYLAESKEEFVAAMERKLKQLDSMISELTQQSASYQNDTKAQAEKTLAALREQRSAVDAKLQQMKKASAEAWHEAKASFFSAMGELEKACESAKSKFNQPSP